MQESFKSKRGTNGILSFSHHIFLAVPQATSPVVKAFIDLALSDQGQQIAEQAGFIPLR